MRSTTFDRRPGRAPDPPATALPAPAEWDAATSRAGLFLLALMPVLALAFLLDARTLAGVSVWDKPLRFAIALGIYLVSLGFVSGFVSPAARARRAYRWPMVAGSASAVLEMGLISLQSARGVGSHFNFGTGFDSAVYAVMGIGSLLLIGMTLPLAHGLARHADARRLPAPLRQALVQGLWLTFALTLLTAGTMAMSGSHGVGGGAAAAPALPLFGWLQNAGDLRVPHFFATHSLHAVPLAVLALSAWRPVGPRGVAALSVLYTAFVLATFAQALAGQPIWPPR
ncbi:hypothetical protein GN316_06360 [Xylophilus sp. Kf1]|nr:hypothetical protein [Xylophilus sp. Kf1]